MEQYDYLRNVQTNVELGDHTSEANEKLRLFLRKLPKGEMIARINDLNLTDDSLEYLSMGVALEHEDYEICAAVQAIQQRRKEKDGGYTPPVPVIW